MTKLIRSVDRKVGLWEIYCKKNTLNEIINQAGNINILNFCLSTVICLVCTHIYLFNTLVKKHCSTTVPLETLKKTLHQLVTINFHLGHGDDKIQKKSYIIYLVIKNGRNIYFVKFTSYAGYIEIVLKMCSQLLHRRLCAVLCISRPQNISFIKSLKK